MLQCNVFPGLPPDFLDSEVNLFLVPFMDSEAESENPPRAGIVPPQGSLVHRDISSSLVWRETQDALVWGGRDPRWSEERLQLVPKVFVPFLRSVFPSCGSTGRTGLGLNRAVQLITPAQDAG